MNRKFTYDWLKLCAVAIALASTGALGMTYTYYRGLTNNPNNAPLKTALSSTIPVDNISISKADVSKTTEPTSFRLSQIPGIISRQTIGLGDATKIASIQIKWPGSSVTEEFYNVDAGKSYFVTEGTKELKLTSLALLSDN